MRCQKRNCRDGYECDCYSRQHNKPKFLCFRPATGHAQRWTTAADRTPNNVHYQYGTASDANINAVGKVVFQEDASGWQKFSYGKLGELTENIRTFALPFENQTYTFRMQYEYDPFNRIQSMLYPDSERVEYGYNLGGMLERVAGNKNGVTYRYIDSILRTITRRHARYAEHLTSPVPVGGSAQRCAFRGTTVSCAEAKGEYGRQGVRWDYATRCVPPIFPSPVAATRASFRRTPSHPWPRLATTVWRNLLRHGQHRRMMNPLPGICPAHRTVSGYRHASPHGDGPSSSTSSCVARAINENYSSTDTIYPILITDSIKINYIITKLRNKFVPQQDFDFFNLEEGEFYRLGQFLVVNCMLVGPSGWASNFCQFFIIDVNTHRCTHIMSLSENINNFYLFDNLTVNSIEYPDDFFHGRVSKHFCSAGMKSLGTARLCTPIR